MQEQKKIKIETESYIFKNDTCCVLSDYFEDNTITVWGFQNETIARQYKTRSDVGMWRIKQHNLKQSKN